LNEKISTESGTAITPDSSGGRSHNSLTCDGDANVKLLSELHPQKQRKPTNSVDEGITIDISDEQPMNASSSIRTTAESAGSGELASFEQRAKLALLKRVIGEGTMIDLRDKQRKNALPGMKSKRESGQNHTASNED
jgi:hypothetical protein